jgi:hypothetical protein
MDVEYNETADKSARAVVDGENSPDITFEDADPPIGGLPTWPQIRHNLLTNQNTLEDSPT